MEEKIISVEMMRKSDAYTIENFVPGRELMYRAAMGVYESYQEWANKKIAITGYKRKRRHPDSNWG